MTHVSLPYRVLNGIPSEIFCTVDDELVERMVGIRTRFFKLVILPQLSLHSKFIDLPLHLFISTGSKDMLG